MSLREVSLIAGLCIAAALGMYWPALAGQLISDDQFILTAPQIQQLSARNLLAILDPRGPIAFTYLNYSPVHALAHAVEIQAFGPQLVGYHVVNVVLHALASVLLAALLVQTGVPRPGALFGAAFFLAHPANVEAVAWISQLKTSSATVLMLGALLVRRSRPALGALLFGLALLAKAHAAIALPVFAVLEWARAGQPDRGSEPARWGWVAVWAGVFVAFAALALPVIAQTASQAQAALETDRLLHARTIVAIAARYLVMAGSGWGVSAMHEPPFATSWSDPWWLAGLLLLSGLAVRLGVTLRQRRVEAAYWLWAAGAFAPISQIFPFVNMMADRYLYFVLPGLIGGVLLAGAQALAAIDPVARARIVAVPALVAGVGVLFLGLRSHERSHVWRHPDAYTVDAALHYPDGINAHFLRARGRAREGDAAGTAAALRAARARGWNWVGVVFVDPVFAPVRNQPAFREIAVELAGDMVAVLEKNPQPTQSDLQLLAQVELWRGDEAAAAAALERALAQDGPAADEIRASLRALRGEASPSQ